MVSPTVQGFRVEAFRALGVHMLRSLTVYGFGVEGFSKGSGFIGVGGGKIFGF